MSSAAVIQRDQLLAQLREPRLWDVLVIGGGATGLGIALEAAHRGFRTALVEARDFASGTSSRSTKLIHGGVRYLAQGNLRLVREALLERARLLANAPRLVRPLQFVVPCYRPFERELMRVGLGAYDALAGKHGIGDTHWLSHADTIGALPGVKSRGLYGGVCYWDAQFDDARLAIALMRTAVRLGAVAINYVKVDQIRKKNGTIDSIVAADSLSGEQFELRAKVVFSATGVWTDDVRRMADETAQPLVTTSRGSHVVVPRSFLPGASGMMIPRTSDGRVLFAIPWHARLIIGTTDIATERATWEPSASDQEVEFILDNARYYLEAPLSTHDVSATFAGLRPLFSPYAAGSSSATKTISREHAIAIEHQNLITVVGGKWTTYRRMALDALDQAACAGLLDARPCTTGELRLDVDDAIEDAVEAAEAAALSSGVNSSGNAIEAFVGLAARHEQALSADDVISRRLRVESLDRAAATQLRPVVERALARSR
ncbi:MAG: glycerol-3-phosphate dehydrogenase/oxidase [Burkholderiaceae bacterium]